MHVGMQATQSSSYNGLHIYSHEEVSENHK